ncbi:MAG: PEP-CTERM sorting domain-containing protein [Verrucomicrobiota bacterium]
MSAIPQSASEKAAALAGSPLPQSTKRFHAAAPAAKLATAGSAAALGAMAITDVDGAVITVVSPGSPVVFGAHAGGAGTQVVNSIDLPGDDALAMRRRANSTTQFNRDTILLRLESPGLGGGLAIDGGGHMINFSAGAVIGPGVGNGYAFAETLTVSNTFNTYPNAANFPAGVDGRFAFSFSDEDDGGTTKYGWGVISYTNGSNTGNPIVTGTATIKELYYEDSGAAITIVPEPSRAGLILLGLGAAGLRRWRRQNTAQA